MPRRLRDPKRRRQALTDAQFWELLLGPICVCPEPDAEAAAGLAIVRPPASRIKLGCHGGRCTEAFASLHDREVAWEMHREELIDGWGPRPWAFWHFDHPDADTGGDPVGWLADNDLLSPEELAEYRVQVRHMANTDPKEGAL